LQFWLITGAEVFELEFACGKLLAVLNYHLTGGLPSQSLNTFLMTAGQCV